MAVLRVGLVILVAVAIAAITTATNFEEITACQIAYGTELGAATTVNERCAAINNLVDCFGEIDNTTVVEQTQINQTIAVAQLAEDCIEYNRNRDIVAPEITLDNGNIDIAVGKGNDVNFFRKQPDLTTSIWTLADELDAITDQVETQACVAPSVLDDAKLSIMNAFQAKVDGAKAEATSQLSQLATTLQQLADNIETNSRTRVNSLQSDLDEVVLDATSALSTAISTQTTRFATIAGAVSSQLQTGSGSLNQQATAAQSRISTFGQTATATISAAQKKVNDAMTQARATLSTVQKKSQDMSSTITQFIQAEVARSSGSVFTNIGRRDCPGGATKLYQGVFYASHHGHQGSSEAICLPNNPTGGSYIGSSSYDILYGMSIDHNHGTPITRTRAIPCARCHIRRPSCFRLSGRADCPDNSDVMYTGWLFGSHYQHAASTLRECISDQFENVYSNTNDYLFASRIQDTSPNIWNDVSTRCVVCCQSTP
jgi:hypothetical protein